MTVGHLREEPAQQRTQAARDGADSPGVAQDVHEAEPEHHRAQQAEGGLDARLRRLEAGLADSGHLPRERRREHRAGHQEDEDSVHVSGG
jgi:hypothetical protein